MIFQREKAHDVFQEMKPLVEKHWREIEHYKDIPLDPDYDTYLKMEDLGILRVYTARDEGKLIGYAVFFIKHHLHNKNSLQAVQDLIFIDPEFRGGLGARFIMWTEKELVKEKVQAVFHHIKIATPKTVNMFENMGYELIDVIAGKRLDGGTG